MISLIIHWNFDPIVFSLFGLNIRYYSVCWLIGIVLAYMIARRIYIKKRISGEKIDELLWFVVIGTLIGARLVHCIFYDWAYFSHHLLEMVFPVSIDSAGVKFTGYAGLASHGGAVGIVIALLFYHRRNKIPFMFLLDTLAFIAPITAAFIRIGNFFNSEIIGGPTDVNWAVVFERVDLVPRHPAQIYEALAYLTIFLVLLVFLKKRKNYVSGQVFGLSVSLIFIARFMIEYCKEVQEPFELGIRSSIGMDMGQLLSIPFILVGLYFLLRRKKKGESMTFSL